MAIIFACSCGQNLQMPEKHAGKAVQCPACKQVVRVPASSAGGEELVEVEAVTEPPRRPPSRPLPQEDREPPPQRQDNPPPLPDLPLEELPNHNGEQLPEDVDFFASPPKGIGPLLSAYSTLRQYKTPVHPGVRLTWIFASAGAGLFIGLLLVILTDIVPLLTIGFILAITFGLIAWYFTRFRYRCTYVGRDGIVRFRCHGQRDNITKEVFFFKDATELRVGQIRNFVNGVYSGTNYNFNWTDVNRSKVFTLSGTYHKLDGNPVAKDPFHFAVAAEGAWSMYLFESVQDLLAGGSTITFGLKSDDSIRIGPGFLTLHQGGKKIRLEGDAIANVRIDQGVVAIREPGAKEGWFSSTGVYKFNYNQLANAQFFLFLMDKLLGVRANG